MSWIRSSNETTQREFPMNIRILFFAFFFILVGCKKEGPPPIALGKCLVDVYEANVAKKQKCNYIGYIWECERTDKEDVCRRGPETGGERPTTPPPVIAEPVPVPAPAPEPAK